MLTKPNKLQPGDKVATISPSWGGAGDPEIRWRYEQGVKRLEEVFGLQVVAMPHSLKGTDYIDSHPEARAQDLMEAFQDKSIKAIIANIGGSDSIRMLPYIDFDIIRHNPKIFMGYSDVTISHLLCHKAGLSSFYGPAILTDFAENVEMDAYTVDHIKRTLFQDSAVGEILPADEWTSEFLEWDISNKDQKRKKQKNKGFELLQGEGTVTGRLIGGCIEVLEFAKGTKIWPEEAYWEDAILFFETSEDKPAPQSLIFWLRNYAAQGILEKAKGIIFGKPQDETHYEAYKESIRLVLKENGLEKMPVLYNLNFGHTEPKIVLPYGVKGEINCQQGTFSIVENAVV
ncbi:S66 family peptidase [Oceanobacillus jordanicus]|uniref:LD-carboxypeptidase n=1 Tax=Oceanobacillus jordanicus TaxID=2867266 RepID=A0AAW5B9C0_9BACI|nr:S66 peptidase family protein [Oceanobacillus jordanicus]MCG3419867.1 LD-carboxypeptidase [Oceanobacillus jordanicus]